MPGHPFSPFPETIDKHAFPIRTPEVCGCTWARPIRAVCFH